METIVTKKYFENLKKEVDVVYDLARKARSKNLDPVSSVEIPLAMNMAEKVVGIISTIYPQMQGSGISERILELEKEFGKLDVTVSFKIAEEVAEQRFCSFENTLQAIDAGIRVGFGYQTIGVVSSPIEGFTGIKVRKTRDGKDYIEASFAGPIRSAGTTASCVVLILIDFLREKFGFAKYDPTEDEVKRVYSELEHFHDRVTNLQYMPTEEETLYLAERMPIQVAGEASEAIEVPNYKNLDRVDTNFLRSGFCLIMAEGLAQKAKKGFRLYNHAKENGIKISGFDWLNGYLELQDKKNSGALKSVEAVPTYIKDLVAGRPVFGHPSRSGSFRFRYGRGRNSGFSAACMHPATMAITDDFISIGNQLKIEKPTKGCVITVCDNIEGPIVKLKDGSVKQIFDKNEAKKIYPYVEEIIYLGDILFPFSDVLNRNAKLIKPGYVEEWWGLELGKKEKDLDVFNIGFDEAVEISKKYGVSFYPKYILYWSQITKENFLDFVSWFRNSVIRSGKIVFPYYRDKQEEYENGKRALEILGVPHDVTIENVVVDKLFSKVLFSNLGIPLENLEREELFIKDIFDYDDNGKENVLEIVNSLSEFEIKDKAGEFIGARMGRPEKAKIRKLSGSPNVLFPVGKEGGRLRSVQAAYEEGRIRSAFPIYFCKSCSKGTIYSSCEDCGTKTQRMFYFPDTKEKLLTNKSEISEREPVNYLNIDLDIVHYFNKAVSMLGLDKNEVPLLIKGVRGTSSEGHVMENLAKGVLRAKYDLQVNKDGTIRFDATELPLVSFKPREIFVSVDKLRSLGYLKDINGKDLVDENQILELMPHDILLPTCEDSPDEKADDVFVNICNFVDELLVRFYKMKPFYNIKSKDDLVGKLGVFMAPHNCAGVICRFIGFSNVQGLVASPYLHAAVRRDCDGDESAIMLLGDVLLNFSRKFLPAHRGGTQDAPLVLNARIDAGEVDDQILDFEVVNEYPLELYRLAEKRRHSSEVHVKNIKQVLKLGEDPFVNLGFTHDTTDINAGVLCSSYKSLGAMSEKVEHQMALVEKLRSVDTTDTARLIIDRHFLRDMRGNLRKFSMQGFRCVSCNEISRRPPLSGVCPYCGGKLIFTIHEGGIKKYLEPALFLAEKYNLSPYMKQNLELVKRYIESIFGKELEKQEALNKWF
jgi:DNA polymerase II large subunit